MRDFPKRGVLGVVATLFAGFAAAPALPGPVTGEESKRQAQVFDQLSRALAAEPKVEAKFALVAKIMKDDPSVDLRRRILETAEKIPGPEIEPFLTTLLTSEPDAGLRSRAATVLGRRGSEKCLSALAQCAEKDKTTDIVMGCIGGQSSARRAATFALAELAARHPGIADEAAAKLRALPVSADMKDNEGLADARIQALYQITRDDTLLKPFYDCLKSREVKDRERGVVAFRFLKIKRAPAELRNALNDTSPEVRSWTALVLGEVGDPTTGGALMATAGNTKEAAGVRCNSINSLGRMKVAAAADLMEKLLTDADGSVQTNAAVALYRITGKKVKQFPAGYNAD